MSEFIYFSEGICPKVNVIVWLEFELSNYNVTIQHVNPYATGPHIFS